MVDAPLDLNSSSASTAPSKRWSPDHKTPEICQRLTRESLARHTIAIKKEDLFQALAEWPLSFNWGRVDRHTSNLSMNSSIAALSPVRRFGANDMTTGQDATSQVRKLKK
jgi:hypothetical protein